MKDLVEAKSTSGFEKRLDEFMENIAIGIQGFGLNCHLRKFLNGCLPDVKRTCQEKVQPKHGLGCAPVHVLLSTIEESPVLDGHWPV